MTTPPPHLRNTSGSRFTQRLGYFLIGTAIGLIALGFLTSSRQRAAQKQIAEQEAAERRAQVEARDAGLASEDAQPARAVPEPISDQP